MDISSCRAAAHVCRQTVYQKGVRVCSSACLARLRTDSPCLLPHLTLERMTRQVRLPSCQSRGRFDFVDALFRQDQACCSRLRLRALGASRLLSWAVARVLCCQYALAHGNKVPKVCPAPSLDGYGVPNALSRRHLFETSTRCHQTVGSVERACGSLGAKICRKTNTGQGSYVESHAAAVVHRQGCSRAVTAQPLVNTALAEALFETTFWPT